jgi:hypothetical protein
MSTELAAGFRVRGFATSRTDAVIPVGLTTGSENSGLTSRFDPPYAKEYRLAAVRAGPGRRIVERAASRRCDSVAQVIT